MRSSIYSPTPSKKNESSFAKQDKVPAGMVQRKCSCGGTCSKCKGHHQDHENNKGDSDQAKVPDAVHEALGVQGQSLDYGTRSKMEHRFGHDFSKVRVHTDTKAAASAQAINASAYTVGNDLVFNKDQYNPHNSKGQELLTHELTHVVQQSANTINKDALRLGKPNDSFEKEADTTASVVAGGRKPQSISPVSSPLIQRSFGSTLLDIALFIPRLFGLEVFTAEDLRKYLDEIKQKKGPSGSLFSDNKARACVSREKEFGPYDTQTKTWLIQDMLDGYTSVLDENSIIALLRRSSDREQIVKTIGRDKLWSNFSMGNRIVIEALTLTAADAGEALISRLRSRPADEIQQFESNAVDSRVKDSAHRALALSKITAPVPSSANVTSAGEAGLVINGMDVKFLPDIIDTSLGKHAFTESRFSIEKPRPIVITPENANNPVGGITPLKISITIQTKYPSEESKTNPSKYGVGTRPGDENTLKVHERAHGQAWIEFLTNNPPPVFNGADGMLPAQYNIAVQQWNNDTKAYTDRALLYALKAGDCVGTLPTDEDYEGTDYKASICKVVGP